MDSSDTTMELIQFAITPTPAKAVELGDKALDHILPGRRATALMQDFERQDEVARVDATRQRIFEIHEHLVLKNASWKDEQERPTPEDVWDVYRRVGEMWGSSGNPKKRKMIEKAFFSAFDPKFYRQGVNAHFLRMLSEIQYPEAYLLRSTQKQGKNVAFSHTDSNLFYANRLAALGLFLMAGNGGGGTIFQPTGIATLFIEFIWDDSAQGSSDDDSSDD